MCGIGEKNEEKYLAPFTRESQVMTHECHDGANSEGTMVIFVSGQQCVLGI